MKIKHKVVFNKGCDDESSGGRKMLLTAAFCREVMTEEGQQKTA